MIEECCRDFFRVVVMGASAFQCVCVCVCDPTEIYYHGSTWKKVLCFPALKIDRLKTDSDSIPGLQSSRLLKYFLNVAIYWRFAHASTCMFICLGCFCVTQFPLVYFNLFDVHVLSRVFRSAPESWRRWGLSSVSPCWGSRDWRGSATTKTCWIWKVTSLGHSLKWSG